IMQPSFVLSGPTAIPLGLPKRFMMPCLMRLNMARTNRPCGRNVFGTHLVSTSIHPTGYGNLETGPSPKRTSPCFFWSQGRLHSGVYLFQGFKRSGPRVFPTERRRADRPEFSCHLARPERRAVRLQGLRRLI